MVCPQVDSARHSLEGGNSFPSWIILIQFISRGEALSLTLTEAVDWKGGFTPVGNVSNGVLVEVAAHSNIWTHRLLKWRRHSRKRRELPSQSLHRPVKQLWRMLCYWPLCNPTSRKRLWFWQFGPQVTSSSAKLATARFGRLRLEGTTPSKEENAIAIAQAIARDEKAVILARVEDLPSWVSIFGLRCDSANLLADMKGRGGCGALFVRLGAWANTADTVSVTCSWRSWYPEIMLFLGV